MAFPSSPALNQEYSVGSKTWKWNGTTWNITATTSLLPTQTGNSGKYLSTDGTAVAWSTVDALPAQTGNAGKFLTTSGTTPSWTTVETAGAGGVIPLNSTSITASYTLPTGKNGFTVGPVSIATGVTVSVPSGQRWVIV